MSSVSMVSDDKSARVSGGGFKRCADLYYSCVIAKNPKMRQEVIRRSVQRLKQELFHIYD